MCVRYDKGVNWLAAVVVVRLERCIIAWMCVKCPVNSKKECSSTAKLILHPRPTC